MAKGDVLGHVKCPDCGTENPLVENKNGNGYFYCRGFLDDGQSCNYHGRYGGASSRKKRALAAKYSRQEKEIPAYV